MNAASTNQKDNTRINAIIPLAVLRTLQVLDRTNTVDLEEYAEEVAPKRLGTSPTVSAQIERFEKLVKREAGIDVEEVIQLFRLVGRRNDAELVFTQAGRAAAEEMLVQRSAASRLVHRAGRAVARQRARRTQVIRLAERLLGVSMTIDEEAGVKAVTHGTLPDSAPDGIPCGFFAAALVELLRGCMDFDGAMLHDECRSRGDEVCSWHSGPFPGM